jgi:hypothetical protein
MPETLSHLDVRREVSLLLEAMCACAQSYGRHANDCPTVRAVNTNARALRLRAALTAHDRRVLAGPPEPCSSCGQPLDPANLCRVNGVGYHLGNCPQPHRDTTRYDGPSETHNGPSAAYQPPDDTALHKDRP